MGIMVKVIDITSQFILTYFFLISFFYIFVIVLSINELRNFLEVLKNNVIPEKDDILPISLLVPAYNEEATIVDNIKSLLELSYPRFEIIVVNDGSKDDTLKKVILEFGLKRIPLSYQRKVEMNEILGIYGSSDYPNLVLVDKINGGKADALNAGINISKYPLFCGIDADCVIEKNALLRIVQPFLKYKETIAVGGIVRIANGCTIKDGVLTQAKLPKNSKACFQILEYFRAFLTSRIGWERINGLLIISGAFGLFRKSAVITVGGYKKTIGEDMELTVRMHEYFRENKIKYKVDYVSDAVCWTQAPTDFKGLKSQRVRWHRGLIDSLYQHKKMLFNLKYGVVGMISMPYFVFVELFGPVVEIIGYLILVLAIITKTLSWFFLLVFVMAYFYGIFFTLTAILFEEFSYKRYSNVKEITKLIWYALIEAFYYRPLTAFWRAQAFLNFKKGSKEWGTIQRKSFDEKEGT
ncbi:MAG: glycosyltransferase family 2 protein [Eubacteriaceae bacterium]